MFREVRRSGRALAVVAVPGLLSVLLAHPPSPVRVPEPSDERRASVPAVFEQPVRATLSGILQRAGKSVIKQLRSVAALSRTGAAGMGATVLVCLGLMALAASRPCMVEGALWRRGERAPPRTTST